MPDSWRDDLGVEEARKPANIKDDWGSTLGRISGQLGAYATAAGLAGITAAGIGASAPVTVPVAGLSAAVGATMFASTLHEDAQERMREYEKRTGKQIDPDTQAWIEAGATGLGAVQALPSGKLASTAMSKFGMGQVPKILQPLSNLLGPEARYLLGSVPELAEAGGIKGAAANATIEALLQGGVNAGAQAGMNRLEQIYRPELDAWEGVGEAGLGGGAIGGGLSLLTSGLGGLARGRGGAPAQRPPVADIAPPDTLEKLLAEMQAKPDIPPEPPAGPPPPPPPPPPAAPKPPELMGGNPYQLGMEPIPGQLDLYSRFQEQQRREQERIIRQRQGQPGVDTGFQLTPPPGNEQGRLEFEDPASAMRRRVTEGLNGVLKKLGLNRKINGDFIDDVTKSVPTAEDGDPHLGAAQVALQTLSPDVPEFRTHLEQWSGLNDEAMRYLHRSNVFNPYEWNLLLRESHARGLETLTEPQFGFTQNRIEAQAVANLFRDRAVGSSRNLSPQMEKLYQRGLNFLGGMGEVLRNEGFKKPEDIAALRPEPEPRPKVTVETAPEADPLDALRQQFLPALETHLRGMNMDRHTGVDLANRILDGLGRRAEGIHLPEEKMVRLAVDALDPALPVEEQTAQLLNVLDRETIHVARPFFGEKEWRLLGRDAEKNGYLTKAYDQYGDQPGYTPQMIGEEAISNMFGEHAGGVRKLSTGSKRIYDRFLNYMRRFGNAFRGLGFQTSDDIFRRLTSGEVGARPEQTGSAARAPEMFALPKGQKPRSLSDRIIGAAQLARAGRFQDVESIFPDPVDRDLIKTLAEDQNLDLDRMSQINPEDYGLSRKFDLDPKGRQQYDTILRHTATLFHDPKQRVSFKEMESDALQFLSKNQLDARQLKKGETLTQAEHLAMKMYVRGLFETYRQKVTALENEVRTKPGGMTAQDTQAREQEIDEIGAEIQKFQNTLVPARSQDGRNLVAHRWVAGDTFDDTYWYGRFKRLLNLPANANLPPQVAGPLNQALAQGQQAQQAMAAANQHAAQNPTPQAAAAVAAAQAQAQQAAAGHAAAQAAAQANPTPANKAAATKAAQAANVAANAVTAAQQNAIQNPAPAVKKVRQKAQQQVQNAQNAVAQLATKHQQSTPWEIITGARKAGLLTGFGTWGGNQLSNLSNLGMGSIASVPGAWADEAMASRTGVRTGVSDIRPGISQPILKAGAKGFLGKVPEAFKKSVEGVMLQAQPSPTVLNKQGQGPRIYNADRIPLIGKTLTKAVHGVFQVQESGDIPWREAHTKMGIEREALVAALNEARAGTIPKDHVIARAAQLAQNPTKEMMEAAIEQSKAGVFAKENWASRGLTKLRRGLLEAESPKALKAAEELATKSAGMVRTPGGGLAPGPAGTKTSAIARPMGNLTGKIVAGLLDWTIPFSRVAGNVVEEAFNYSPFGAAHVAVRLPHTIKNLINKSLSPMDQNIMRELAGKASTGTLVYTALGYILAKNGVITGIRDPTDVSGRATDEALRRSDGAIKIGPYWLQMGRAAPLGNAIGLGASIYREMTRPGKNPAAGVARVGAAFGQYLLQQPMAVGLDNLVTAFKHPGEGGEAWWHQAGASMIPTVIANLGETIDPWRRNPRGRALGGVERRLPFVRQNLAKQADVLGRDIPQPGFSVLGPLFDPFRTLKEDQSPLLQEIKKIDFSLGRVKKDTEHEEQEATYQMRSRLSGQLFYRLMSELIESPEYQDLETAQEKRDMLTKFRSRGAAVLSRATTRNEEYRALSEEDKQKRLQELLENPDELIQ